MFSTICKGVIPVSSFGFYYGRAFPRRISNLCIFFVPTRCFFSPVSSFESLQRQRIRSDKRFVPETKFPLPSQPFCLTHNSHNTATAPLPSPSYHGYYVSTRPLSPYGPAAGGAMLHPKIGCVTNDAFSPLHRLAVFAERNSQ